MLSYLLHYQVKQAGTVCESGAEVRKSRSDYKGGKIRMMYCKRYSPLLQVEHARNHRYFQSLLTTGMLYSALNLYENFC